jgi:hypothetical protein
MANLRALRLDPRADFRSRIDHNLYFGTAALVEIQDTASYRASSLGRLFAEYGIEKHGIAADPLFVSPNDGDYRLRPNSPALRAGAPDLGVTKDAAGRAFASPPSIGAFEA